ncbi:MAG: hypothetical protein HRU24_03040 [Gammaproteobacteria bacterium]|nr:hypothetical protein [Gammaproteobacteria bacterium]
MKRTILATVLGFSFVAASASAAVSVEEVSTWRKTKVDNVIVTTDATKNQEWQIVKVAKKDKNQETQAWRRIRI